MSYLDPRDEEDRNKWLGVLFTFLLLCLALAT